jgi:hypothetical protein
LNATLSNHWLLKFSNIFYLGYSCPGPHRFEVISLQSKNGILCKFQLSHKLDK